MRRLPLAHLLLTALTLLALGAFLLGVSQAPTGADVAIHNGATNTLAASRIVGHYTTSSLGDDVVRFVFTAPDHASAIVLGSNGAVKTRRSVSGASATGILSPLTELLSISGFTGPGPVYVLHDNLSDVEPASDRGVLSGTYRTTVRVAGGYVVGVNLDIAAVEGGEHLSERVRYHLTQIGSWRSS